MKSLIIAAIGTLAFSSVCIYGIIFFTPDNWEEWGIALSILSITLFMGIFFLYLYRIEKKNEIQKVGDVAHD